MSQIKKSSKPGNQYLTIFAHANLYTDIASKWCGGKSDWCSPVPAAAVDRNGR